MTQGVNLGPPGVNGQRGQTRRRLDAGEARHGGEARKSSCGDQINGGAHLRVAGARARRVVLSASSEMAQNYGGDGKRGGWHLGIERIDGAGHGRSRG